jgi:hypothetical protein
MPKRETLYSQHEGVNISRPEKYRYCKNYVSKKYRIKQLTIQLAHWDNA